MLCFSDFLRDRLLLLANAGERPAMGGGGGGGMGRTTLLRAGAGARGGSGAGGRVGAGAEVTAG